MLLESLKYGVNLFHTSARYMKKKSIKIVRKVIKGRRDNLYLAVKDNFESIEDVLKKLGTNYIDFIMFNRHNPDGLRNDMPEIKRQFKTWRGKGLVGHAGFTTHKNMAECLDIALAEDIFSVMMPSLTPKEFDDLAPQREMCRKKKVSILAMKTKGELESEEYPAQIRTVLADPAVCTVCKAVMTMEDLKAWTAAAKPKSTGFLDRNGEVRHARARAYDGCGLCGLCERSCKNGVKTADIVRCVRYYHDAEGMPDIAAENFFELGCAGSLDNCEDCGLCERACPQRIKVRKALSRARKLWC
jgi:predicted aldo/keto reductase-like oxidoreductase